LLSIIIGTLGALYQVKIKRLLAYSAISHVGFLLLGFFTFSNFSLFAMFFYILVYIIISLNLFAILLSLRKKDNNLKFKRINEFVVLFKSNKLLAINLSIILFSITGIPPLVGFYSKFYIFISAIKIGVYLVALIAAIFSVIAAMYYIRLIKLMFFKDFDY
jgi:NADH:ubiquinone oxidoreductase subunit 2 (subunit N)